MSFLRDYAIYTEENEVPETYHTWSGLVALACFAGRRFWIDQGIFRVFPNLYVVLVGDPGIKKSTAKDLARNLVEEVGSVDIGSDSMTREAICQRMSKDDGPCDKRFKVLVEKPDGTSKYETVRYSLIAFFSDEFENLLNAGGAAQAMVTFLTEIWSRKHFRNTTKNKGDDVIEGPTVNILACMTTDTKNNLLAQKIISSGFSRRCIFVYEQAEKEKDYPFVTVTPEMEAAWTRLVDKSKAILLKGGKFEWNDDAKTWWVKWYSDNRKRLRKEKSAFKSGYLRSKQVFLLKVAMLISLSEYDDLILRVEALNAAELMLSQLEPNMEIAFEGTGRNVLGSLAAQVERFILESSDIVPARTIIREFYKDAKTPEINEILQSLVDSGKILSLMCKVKVAGNKLIDQKAYSSHEALESWKRTKMEPLDFSQSSSAASSATGLGKPEDTDS